MPAFSYKGTDEKGVEREGRVEASGLVDAAARLRGEGIAPSVLERADREPVHAGLGDVDDFVFFNRSLAEMTRLGLPLPRALREIAGGLRRGKFKANLEKLEASVREGKSLDASVAELGDAFPPHYRWMLKAGAKSGRLPLVLSAVARNTEGLRIARRSLIGSLTYPAIVLAFGLLVIGAFLFIFVPIYRDLFRQYGLEPSLTTRAIFAMFGSTIVPLSLATGLVGLALGLRAWMRRSLAGEKILLKVPLLGAIHRNLCLARLLGTLEVLLGSGMPLKEALPVALGASGSLQMSQAAEKLQARAEEGAGAADVLAQAPILSPGVAAYLRQGERAGRLSEAAGEVGDLLTRQAIDGSDTLFLILLPAALLLVGAIMVTLFASLVFPYANFLERFG